MLDSDWGGFRGWMGGGGRLLFAYLGQFKMQIVKIMVIECICLGICVNYVWTFWSKYIKFCMDHFYYSMSRPISPRVFIQSTSNLGTMILRFWGGVL